MSVSGVVLMVKLVVIVIISSKYNTWASGYSEMFSPNHSYGGKLAVFGNSFCPTAFSRNLSCVRVCARVCICVCMCVRYRGVSRNVDVMISN